MIETPVMTVPRATGLDDILPAARNLSVQDNLTRIKILAEELRQEHLFIPAKSEHSTPSESATEKDILTIPSGTCEFYTPYEIEGFTKETATRWAGVLSTSSKDANQVFSRKSWIQRDWATSDVANITLFEFEIHPKPKS